jgi:hypothetical protein
MISLKLGKFTMVAGGAVLSVGVASLALIGGCGGGDDTTSSAAVDGSVPPADGTVPRGDALASDVTVAEGGGGSDAPLAVPDGGHAADASLGPDGEGAAPTDSGQDAGAPVDAAVVEVDATSLAGFPHAFNAAYCERLRECCGVPIGEWRDSPDGGCTVQNDKFGGLGAIAAYNAALDSGAIAYSPARAAACLQEVAQIGCGVYPASTQNMIIADCFAAMQGTLIAGKPCVDSLECASGEFCEQSADGGANVCTALVGVGGPCSDTTRSTDCSYLGHGTPALFCGPNGDAGDAGNSCQTVAPLSGSCKTNPQCSPNTCGSASTCVNAVVFSDPGVTPGTCAFYTMAADGG